jgi:uncharacterized membrane protein YhaH (DUF805 family)
MNPLTRPWRHLFDFSGRATRTEYLLFHVIGFVAVMIAGTIVGVIAALIDGGNPHNAGGDYLLIPAIILSYGVFLVTHIAIAVRRLHDHGEPGIKYLLTFIPLIGIVFWFMLVFTRGDDFENDYGYDPRQGEPVATSDLSGVFS